MKINSLIKNYLSFSYGSFVGIFLGLAMTLISTRLLNPSEFGKVNIFLIMVNFFMLLNLMATDQSYSRFYYEVKNQKKLFIQCLKIAIYFFAISTIIIYYFYKPILSIFFEDPAVSLAICILFTSLLQILYRLGTITLRMELKGKVFSNLEILTKTTNILFIYVYYLMLGKSFYILIYATMSSLFVSCIFIIYYIFFKIFKLKNNVGIENTNERNEGYVNSKLIIRYGYPLMLAAMVTWFLQSFDKFALQYFSSSQETGLYSAAFKLISLMNIFQMSFSTFWMPLCFKRFKENPEEKEFYIKVFNMVSLGMFTISIITIIFKDILVDLLGNEYSDTSKLIPFLIFMPLMYTISETTVVGINLKKKSKNHLYISIIVSLMNFVLCIILIPYLNSIGAAIALSISYIFLFYVRTYFSNKHYKINFDLLKINSLVFLLFLFASFSILIQSKIIINVMIIIIQLAVFIIYRNEIKGLIKQFMKRRAKNE